MEVQLDKLLHLIADLLDASIINSDRLNCLMNKFSINSCIIDRVESIQTANAGCRFLFELDGTDPFVKGDAERIYQVLTNLINNAIKYSDAHKEVLISSSIEGEHVKVCVTDNGIGIHPEAQQQIFERFYRIEQGVKATATGLGLGLFIASEIVKKHNGQIGVQSEPGKGSTFWFSLPLK